MKDSLESGVRNQKTWVASGERRATSDDGFTVIEILIVAVVVGILAVAVIPRLAKSDFYNKYLDYTTAHRIAADTRLARRLAITTRNNHRLRCYSSGGGDYDRYVIEEENGAGWTQVGEEREIPDTITVSGDSEAEFLADGSAQDSATFRYVIGSYRYRVDVKQETGRVKLEEY